MDDEYVWIFLRPKERARQQSLKNRWFRGATDSVLLAPKPPVRKKDA